MFPPVQINNIILLSVLLDTKWVIIERTFDNKWEDAMEREMKEKLILEKMQSIRKFSDILIDILYGLLCG